MMKLFIVVICLIGDEFLFGWICDINIQIIVKFLVLYGIFVREVWIVLDEQECIVEVVNSLCIIYIYVFIIGGIGLMYDDIIVDVIVVVFNVGILEYLDVVKLLEV